MRKLLLLAVIAALAAPSLSLADWSRARKGSRGAVRTSGAYRAVRAPPAPTPPRTAPSPAPPRVTYRGSGPVYVVGADYVPFWAGLSWGWGYYPLWSRPYGDGSEPRYVPADERRVAARLDAYGAGDAHGAAGTLAVSMEGPIAGFAADVTGLALADASSATTNAALTLGSARATWSIVSDESFRLRVELGGSMLSVPATGTYAGTPYANTMSFGPQVGVSGTLGLVGPIGFEAHARVTPYPVPVFDARAAVVLRGGPFALSGGWRQIDVNGNGLDEPAAHFKGPELGLQLVF